MDRAHADDVAVDLDHQAAFHETLERLQIVQLRLPRPPGALIVLRDDEDPAILHTIGWFHDYVDLDAMREHGDARRLLEELGTSSSEFRPTAHRVIRTGDDGSAAASSYGVLRNRPATGSRIGLI